MYGARSQFPDAADTFVVRLGIQEPARLARLGGAPRNRAGGNVGLLVDGRPVGGVAGEGEQARIAAAELGRFG